MTIENPPVQCVVCLHDIDPLSKQTLSLGCGHSYHLDCITKWFTTNTTCPVCRVNMKIIAPLLKVEEEEKKKVEHVVKHEKIKKQVIGNKSDTTTLFWYGFVMIILTLIMIIFVVTLWLFDETPTWKQHNHAMNNDVCDHYPNFNPCTNDISVQNCNT